MPRKKYWKKARSKGLGVLKSTCLDRSILEAQLGCHSTNTSLEEKLDKISMVLGSFHQGHGQFGTNAGKQCVANSCSAICYDHIKPATVWTGDDLDKILMAGDRLYSVVKPSLPVGQIFLLISELPHYMELFEQTFSMTINASITGLVIGNLEPGMECDVVMSFLNALNTAFNGGNSCFLTFKQSTIAIIRRADIFIVFDSHSRDASGVQVIDGKSVVLQYTCVEELHSHCLRLAASLNIGEFDEFELTVVTVGIVSDIATSQLENDKSPQIPDVSIVHYRDQQHTYHPLSSNLQCMICMKLGVHLQDSVKTDNTMFEDTDLLGNPCKTRAIQMDGNCFFRALSYAISGTEENHRKIRLAVVNHLLEKSALFRPFLRHPHTTVDEYIRVTRMKYLNKWATELEILGAASLLQVDIYTYTTRWLKYSRKQFQSYRTETEIIPGIYLQHLQQSHYEVVTCVKQGRGDSCSGICNKDKAHNQRKLTDYNPGEASLPKRVCQNPGISLQSEKGTPPQRKGITDEFPKKIQRLKYKQEKNLHMKLKYQHDQRYRKKLQEYSKNKYRQDGAHHKYLKTRSIKKYAKDKVHRQNVKAYSKEKYAMHEYHRQNVKAYSKDKYAMHEEHRQNVKAYSKKKYAADQDYKKSRLEKYSNDPNYRKAKLARDKEKYMNCELEQQKKKMNVTFNRRRKNTTRTDLKKMILNFKQLIKEAPEHICAVCNRRLFRKQVLICRPEAYHKKNLSVQELAERCISTAYLHKCSSHCTSPCGMKNSAYSRLWICYNCHRKLLCGKLPPEATSNNLHVNTVPDELACLNSLEQHLVAKHIPFAKVAGLPKGGQRGVHGPVVCVPSNIDKTVSSLPRCESEDQMIRVKLKRKLTYKGHYKYQFISTGKIQKALEYLSKHNQHYKGVTFNKEWSNSLPMEENTSLNEDDSLPDLTETDPMNNTDDISDTSQTVDHGMYMDSCLQPVDIGQEILDQQFDKVLCLAPAEGNDPIKILMDKENEAKSFPVLYPNGSPTYNDEREVSITIARYLHTRLMLADTRFARNTEYIFYAQYLSEVYQVLSSVSIALRKSYIPTNDMKKAKVTCEQLTNNESLREILKCDSGYKFLKPIRGTPSYWQSAQKDLFAMLRQLGIPTWFCSFSAGDMRWPEIIEALLREEGLQKNIQDLDWTAKCELLRGNPVTAARMFEHRFQCFLKEVILSSANPIGKVIDYFYRVEFQQRGSPHVHCLFWVENAPQLDKDPDEVVSSFINQYVTCETPDSDDEELYEIVTTVQKHSRYHSKSCRKKGTKCRFNFPRPPSKRTYISRPNSTATDSTKNEDDLNTQGREQLPKEMKKEEAKQILQNIWKALENPEELTESLDELFAAVGVDQEIFEMAIDKLSNKASIVLERNVKDVWINQYNQDLLRAWNANMDIQFVLDAYSCVMYIISYISKAEREMGMLLEQARKETLDGNEDAKQAMKKLGGVYLHSREVSAQEAVYRVCNLHLKECSRLVQFIPVGDSVRMTLPLSVLKKKSGGNDLEEENIYMTSIIDRYKKRPDTAEFQEMCLAEFCSQFRVLTKSEEPSNRKKLSTHVYELKNGLGYIRKRTRTKPAVIRYPRFSLEKHPEKYYATLLQLFLPYISDKQLKPSEFESKQDFYTSGAVKVGEHSVSSVKEIVTKNKALFEKDADKIDEAEQILEENGPLEDAWSTICPETEAERLSCREEKVHNSTDPESDADIPDLMQAEKRDHTIEICQHLISDEEAKQILRSLNEVQRKVFYKIREWCLQKRNKQEPEPLFLFITGGAGTGKSHLIKAIYYEADRILAQILPNPDDISVLLTAPTGVAAFNINASTIHSTFSISVDAKLPYQPLGEEKLNSLRAKLENLQILIIDEISMVDQKLFAYIHGRLRQIKQCKDYSPFGKVSVIAVGDFYQLPPVKGKSLHSKAAGPDLWNDNFRIVELTEIMRQKNASFSGLLNRLRTRNKADQICPDDVKLLQQRETGEDIDAVHIYSTNAQVNEYNMEKLIKVCTDIVTIDAQDYAKDAKSGKMKKRESPFINTFNSTLARRVSLGIGARVLLTKNIDISDGLVNGVFGTVSYIPPAVEEETVPSVIYIIFDNEKVGLKLRKQKRLPSSIPENSTPITREEDRVNTCGGTRKQFPLKLSFACTVHKLQGITLDKAVVSLDKIFAAGQAYVALSRVKSLQGLVVENLIQKAIYCNEKVDLALSSMAPFLSECNSDINTSDVNKCKIILHNVQGLQSHLKDIEEDNRFLSSHFICFTETWLTAKTQQMPIIENFDFYHKSRTESYDESNDFFTNLKHQCQGGVGVYHQENTHFQILNNTVKNIENLLFYTADWDIAVAIIYRPTSFPLPQFRQNLQELIEQLTRTHNRCLIMGDFNENYFTSFSVSKTLNRYGFEQHVTGPTTEGGTLIDHVYVKNICPIDVVVTPVYFSYHEAVTITFL